MSSNIEKVQIIAQALGELKDQVVFVGGSITELYADNPELSDIRPTIDVDCVVDLISYLDYGRLEELLRNLGFQNDTRAGAPICRKIYKGIEVDFMPTSPDILGFSNIWYKDGIDNKTSVVLPNRISIFIMPVEYYIATKFEAVRGRGGADIRGSHDWEDIVYVLVNCGDFLQKVQQCNNEKLVSYLKEKFAKLLSDGNIKENIYTALPYNSEEEAVNEVLNLMRKI